VVRGPGGAQALLLDSDGNLVELFEPADRGVIQADQRRAADGSVGVPPRMP